MLTLHLVILLWEGMMFAKEILFYTEENRNTCFRSRFSRVEIKKI